MDRRSFFKNSTTAILAAFIPAKVLAKEAKVFEITRTKREWKALLSDLEYKVMRKHGTERAFTSPLDKLFEEGVYHCKGCDLSLYSSAHKYNSGTGWPSFWQALPGAIGTQTDKKFFMVRKKFFYFFVYETQNSQVHSFLRFGTSLCNPHTKRNSVVWALYANALQGP